MFSIAGMASAVPVASSMRYGLALRSLSTAALAVARANAERHVIVRRPARVETIGVGEYGGVAVGRRVEQQHLLAGLDVLAV